MEIVGYICLPLLVILSITSLPISLIGGLFVKVIKNPLLAMLIGGIITWVGIDLLWGKIFSNHIPVLLFLLCFLALGAYSQIENKSLTETSKFAIGGEQAAIVLTAIYSIITSESVNWY
ncbi:hypothetical protein [Lewinella sp. W8]|uniref:hypothetical protein n=1 Tax=Lewinella sp. W8 TaxID=2528208 RepID=UPI0010685A4A|nr:hypothetical protein [Lewinella sp. W8]MTB53930.1 hypothetical protein [Lewinella sp. W8]